MRQQRILPVFALLLLGFVLVGLRLVKLQGLESEMWMRESERSTVRFDAIPFERGWIFDRRGRPLARTQEVRDLVFRFRGWRRDTVAGQSSHAWVTLGAERLPVAEAVERAGELADGLGALRCDEISALEPRQRRRDLGFYLERLFGAVLWDAVVDELQADTVAPVTLAELPGFEAGLQRAYERAAAERQALTDLGDVTGLGEDELVRGMEQAALRADKRVALGLERELLDAPDEERERDGYRREQQLRAEFDADPLRLAAGVSYDARTLVAIRGHELGGLDIRLEKRRIYPDDVADLAPTIIGRVGRPGPDDIDVASARRMRLADLSSVTTLTPEELDELERLRIQVREVDYKLHEERGVHGLESALEDVLRGKRGWVASSEHVDRERVERQEPRRGLNVVLSLDSELQRAAQEVLDEVFERPLPVLDDAGIPLAAKTAHWSGALVVMDVPTGQLRVLASGPRPTAEQMDEQRAWLMDVDEWKRIRHRAIDPGRSGILPPPGSTFKPVSALAGLAAPGPLVGPHTTFLCEGALNVGDRTMGCLGNHGEIGLAEALARSCNIYFYRLGRAVGIDALADMARRFGFASGKRTGLVSGNEVLDSLGVPVASGVHEAAPRLGPGETTTDAMRLAIGQAPLDDVTPLQVATMMAAVSTGALRQPSLIAAIEGYPDIPPREARDLGVSRAALEAVRHGLAQVVDSEVGTGRRLQRWFREEMPWMEGQLCAKTGTAEAGHRPDQSWFAGYLPRHDPKIAFAVLIEDCGYHGSEAALPVFREFIARPAVRDFLRSEVLGLPTEQLPRAPARRDGDDGWGGGPGQGPPAPALSPEPLPEQEPPR